ncbi:Protein RRP6-like 3 [Linum perenne]
MDEKKYRIRIVVTLISLAAAAVTVAFTAAQYRRRRKAKERSKGSCYLHAEGKPQFGFRKVFADNSFSHFKHSKTNNGESKKAENGSNTHPFEQEVKALLDNPPAEFEFDVSSWNKELSDSYVWIETESQLKELVELLSEERVFGVDTEQHSLRSFLGFTALIQIATRTEDYLVDTIALHDSMGVLGPVFADPNICKVFHGADNDVLWLQRDFHIYVVNLFDTAKACEILSKPQKSLAYLLETYCGVYSNKLLQREDWRLRPLSSEMLEYAQTDAHYLLYIAHCLIGELRQQDIDNSPSPDEKLQYVEATRRSNMICMQLYTKEIDRYPGEAAASSILSRHFDVQEGSSISSETQGLVRRLCTWRELMARVHDESLRYVLSDQAIVSLGENSPTNLTELSQLIADADNQVDPVNSTSFLPLSTVVASHLDDLFDIILDRESKLDDIISTVLQNCLGENGSCPLSIYNYALLMNGDFKLTNRTVSKQKGGRNSKQARKTSRARQHFVQKFSCKAPVYHNCRIYANDGRLLCYCDKRKLEWYLRRDLAKLVDEEPPAIMLLFEPKGRPEDEDNDFYIQSKRNICVGCGEGGHYLRYRIIPSCYRIHFPEHLKSHRSHDIVLLCVDCHEVAHAAAEKHKRKIAAQYDIPLFVRRVVDLKEATILPEPASSIGPVDEPGVSPLQLRTAAMALLRHGKRMPSKRHDELRQIVMQYYGGREVSEDDLERALLVGMSPHERRRFQKKRGISSKQSPRNSEEDHDNATEKEMGLKNTNHVEREEASDTREAIDEETNGVSEDATYLSKNNSKLSLLGHGPHGKQVVEHLMKEEGEEGIRQFCQTWRQVFVEALNPRFLPSGWTVMHRI